MRLVGTTRTAVAVLLFGFAMLASSDAPGSEEKAVAAPKQAEEPPFSLAWAGDLTLGSSYGNPPNAGRGVLAAARKALREADLTAVNYEGTFGPGGSSKCGPGSENCFAFQAPPGNARTLRWAGVDIVNQANNHAFDYGPVGWRASRSALERADVEATGAPGEIVTITRKGKRIAFTGFSTYTWSNPMGNDAAVRALVKRAAARADLVVAFFHAGAEGADKTHVPRGPESAFGEYRGDSRHFARVAIDAGADVVLGSGPHVLRGLELYKNRLIAYSLGNLGGYHNFGTGGNSALTAVLTIAVEPSGRFLLGNITSLKLDGAAIPHADTSRGAAKLVRSLSRADFPSSPLRISTRGPVTPKER